MSLTIQEATFDELPRLTELFNYNDPYRMVVDNALRIASGNFSIYLLFEGEDLIGEIHVTWRSDDPLAAIDGQRAYLSAFRIREEKQGVGYGQVLLHEVIAVIEGVGYREITIGVEDDNARARHLYAKYGFTEFVQRRRESYQGDSYEYDLLLRRS